MRHILSIIQTHLQVTSHEAIFVGVFAAVVVTGTIASKIIPLGNAPDLHDHTSAETVIRILDSLGTQPSAAVNGDSGRQLRDQTDQLGDARPQSVASKGRPLRAVMINRASAQELEQLPGIGPAMALRIIERRRSRAFTSPEDLLDVKGIGPKTLERLRPYIVVP